MEQPCEPHVADGHGASPCHTTVVGYQCGNLFHGLLGSGAEEGLEVAFLQVVHQFLTKQIVSYVFGCCCHVVYVFGMLIYRYVL